jgi:two-component system, response regulator RegA
MLRYLVIEDDAVFRTRLVDALQKRGNLAWGADSIGSATELLRQQRIDRCIVDLRIGTESGMDALRTIRSQAPEARAVMLTGFGNIPSAMQAMQAGAVHYLTKPVSVDEILQAFEGDKAEELHAKRLPSLDQVEWEYIHKVLAMHEGNITKAAQALGMHRRSLQRKLAKEAPRR